MRKIKLIHQLDSRDCGVACIAMIADFYGLSHTTEDIRQMCHVSKSGISLKIIANILEELGFKTIGGLITSKTLIAKAMFPCILHWEQDHFVVIYAVKTKGKKRVFHIADPAQGYVTYDEADFESFWISNNDRGVVLLMQPISIIQREKKNENRINLKYVLNYFKPYKRYIIQLLLGLIVVSIIQILFPFLTQSIIDVGIENNNISFVLLILIAQFALLLGKMSIEFVRNWIFLHISTRINVSMLSDFFIKLMRLPMSFFDSKLIGDVLQRLEDHSRIEKFLTSQTLGVFFSFFESCILCLYARSQLVADFNIVNVNSDISTDGNAFFCSMQVEKLDAKNEIHLSNGKYNAKIHIGKIRIINLIFSLK